MLYGETDSNGNATFKVAQLPPYDGNGLSKLNLQVLYSVDTAYFPPNEKIVNKLNRVGDFQIEVQRTELNVEDFLE